MPHWRISSPNLSAIIWYCKSVDERKFFNCKIAFLVSFLNLSPAFNLAFGPLPFDFLATSMASEMLSMSGFTVFSPI